MRRRDLGCRVRLSPDIPGNGLRLVFCVRVQCHFHPFKGLLELHSPRDSLQALTPLHTWDLHPDMWGVDAAGAGPGCPRCTGRGSLGVGRRPSGSPGRLPWEWIQPDAAGSALCRLAVVSPHSGVSGNAGITFAFSPRSLADLSSRPPQSSAPNACLGSDPQSWAHLLEAGASQRSGPVADSGGAQWSCEE